MHEKCHRPSISLRRPTASLDSTRDQSEFLISALCVFCIVLRSLYDFIDRPQELETKMFLPHPLVKLSIVGSLRYREVAC